MLSDVACLYCRYQFSLAYFTRMFSQCITDSTKSDDVATRLRLLSDHTTSFVFKSVSRYRPSTAAAHGSASLSYVS
jgi:hypothetical protein